MIQKVPELGVYTANLQAYVVLLYQTSHEASYKCCINPKSPSFGIPVFIECYLIKNYAVDESFNSTIIMCCHF